MRFIAVFALVLLPACGGCGSESLVEEPKPKQDTGIDDRVVLDSGVVAHPDATAFDDAFALDAIVADEGVAIDAAADDASADDASADDASAEDAGVADSAVDPCPPRAIFLESFETYLPGEALTSAWTSTITGPGEVRINLDAEGEGAGPSARYLILRENDASANVQFASPEIDLRACANRIVTVDARLVPFSLAALTDVLMIEAADDGMSFADLGTLFPGAAFTDNICEPGSQQGTAGPGCVPWGSFSYSVPTTMFTARFRVGLRLIGDGGGAVGIDDFSINVR